MSDNNNQQQNANQQPSRPGSRFGSSRFSSSNQNANQQQQQQPAAPPSRPSRFGRSNPFSNNNSQINWMTQPLYKTLVRFELQGLGDPFYRLLGHEVNTAYGNSREVSRALEAGGEHAEAIEKILNDTWATYDLTGAMLVYTWNSKAWKSIAAPVPMPNPSDDTFYDDDDDDDNQNKDTEPAPPPFKVLRAIDLQLVLNVLSRARSQLLLADAPVVFSQQYLNRALVTDDPRLVAIAQATGSLEEV